LLDIFVKKEYYFNYSITILKSVLKGINTMEKIPTILLIIFFALLIIVFIIHRCKKKSHKKNTDSLYKKLIEHEEVYVENNSDEDDENINYDTNDYFPYHKKTLLTDSEYEFFKNLRKAIEPFELSIITKIRMADLIGVNSDIGKQYMSYFAKIRTKYIDFALVNPDSMEIKFLIELDDKNHCAKNGVKKDAFVNKLLETTGYKLIRTYGDLSEIINSVNADRSIKKRDDSDVDSTNLIKMISELNKKVINIEKILTEVDDTPYVIKKED
jgi:very-short-patch-repair endonuclease